MYTLVERGRGRRLRHARSQSISRRRTTAATNGAWRAALADPAVAVVTLTVTEAGYHATSGELDAGLDDVAARVGGAHGPRRARRRRAARRGRRAGPIAVVSCDNLPDERTRAPSGVVRGHRPRGRPRPRRLDRRGTSRSSRRWSTASRPPRPTTTATTARALTGFADAAPVVTEPFSEWVLSGDFPAGRPPWEAGGARFVDDIEPYERRKLWLLNAGHSLLAYRGPAARPRRRSPRRCADPLCATQLEQLWEEARPVLPFDDAEVDDALAALRDAVRQPAHRAPPGADRDGRVAEAARRGSSSRSRASPRRGPAGRGRRSSACSPRGPPYLGAIRSRPTSASAPLADALRETRDPAATAPRPSSAALAPDLADASLDPLADPHRRTSREL